MSEEEATGSGSATAEEKRCPACGGALRFDAQLRGSIAWGRPWACDACPGNFCEEDVWRRWRDIPPDDGLYWIATLTETVSVTVVGGNIVMPGQGDSQRMRDFFWVVGPILRPVVPSAGPALKRAVLIQGA
jgi:hypothetical protein